MGIGRCYGGESARFLSYFRDFTVMGLLGDSRVTTVRLLPDWCSGVRCVGIQTAVNAHFDGLFASAGFLVRSQLLDILYEEKPPGMRPGRWLCFLVSQSLGRDDEIYHKFLDLPIWNEVLVEASRMEAALVVLDS